MNFPLIVVAIICTAVQSQYHRLHRHSRCLFSTLRLVSYFSISFELAAQSYYKSVYQETILVYFLLPPQSKESENLGFPRHKYVENPLLAGLQEQWAAIYYFDIRPRSRTGARNLLKRA